MPIKTILVLLDTEAQATGVTKAAIAVAKLFSAHLIGLHVVPNAFIPASMAYEATGELIEAQRQAYQASGTHIGETFNTAIAGEAIPVEWRKVEANFEPVASVAMRHGREADLMVLAQPDRSITLIDGIAMTEEVMLGLGRPVYVVPTSHAASTVGKRVLLAWNASRESARAAFDAMPFLQQAESVRILEAGPVSRSGWMGALEAAAPTSGIATTLERHGVRCSVAKATASGADVATEILAQAKEHRCDLIVMGGYGHWRIREIVFGGATRSMLDRTTIPILMSH
jgi:nucleotide-binding universal stress UspA family protein